MRYASTRLEARLSPLGTDLGEVDPVVELRQAMAIYGSSYTAALSLDRGAWQAAGIAVRAIAACDDAGLTADETYVALARPPPARRVVPWLTLSPVTVLVIPRLSALARTSAFVREIETAAGQRPLRWIQRP